MKSYCENYDSYYDESGNWLEKDCTDPECEYCAKRPNKHPKDCERCNKTKKR